MMQANVRNGQPVLTGAALGISGYGARVVNQPSQHLLGITHIAIPDFVETKMSVYDIHESSPSPATE